MKRTPRLLWFIVRLGGAIGISTFLVRSLDISMLKDSLDQLDYFWLSLCIFIPVLGIVLSACKWRLVLNLLGERRPYGELLLRYWSGTFYNAVLPGSVGGDVVRIGGLARANVPFAVSGLSVLGDRAVGLWASMFIGLLSSIWPSDTPLRGPLGLIFGAIVMGGAFGVWLMPKFRKRLPLQGERYIVVSEAIITRRFWYIILLGCVFQLLVVLHLYVAARALHTPISFLVCSLYAPVIILTTLLPISLNGIGVREATLVVLLAGIGISGESATLMGVIIYITAIVASLPGGLAGLAISDRSYDNSAVL